MTTENKGYFKPSRIISKEIQARLTEKCTQDPTLTTSQIVAWIKSEFDIKTNVDQMRHYLVKLRLPYKKKAYTINSGKKSTKGYVIESSKKEARQKALSKEEQFMKGVCYKTGTITR